MSRKNGSRRSLIPANLRWRNGRPRWEPGPTVRARGYKGQDLKDVAGGWLTKGAAVEAAETLNAAVRGAQPLPVAAGTRTFAMLVDAYKASDRFKKKIAPRTRKDYAAHLALLEQAWGGVPVAAIKRADIENLYGELRQGRGVARAAAIMRTLKLLLNFADKALEWVDRNRAAGLEIEAPAGRTVMWTPAEITAFVAAADWCGRASQADACILGLCTGQNRADVLTFSPFVIEEGVYHFKRRKTGRDFYVPPVDLLTERLTVMRARKARLWPNVCFPTELVCTTTGQPYPADGHYFIHEHLAVRFVASGLLFAIEDIARAVFGLPPLLRNLPFTPCPSVWTKRFQDLRDTAITMLLDATGGDIARVANISGHSLKTAQAVIDKHYSVRNAASSIATGRAFDALLKQQKIGG